MKALHNQKKKKKKKAVEYSLKAEKKEFPIAKIYSAEDAVNFARQFYHDDISIYESSFILLMNQANNVTGYAKISQGGICTTIVYVRLVAKYAIDALAPAVIFLHNHPSGNTNPSNEDVRLTAKIRDGLKMLDVKLLDSIVITEDSYLSMSNEGLI